MGFSKPSVARPAFDRCAVRNGTALFDIADVLNFGLSNDSMGVRIIVLEEYTTLRVNRISGNPSRIRIFSSVACQYLLVVCNPVFRRRSLC